MKITSLWRQRAWNRHFLLFGIFFQSFYFSFGQNNLDFEKFIKSNYTESQERVIDTKILVKDFDIEINDKEKGSYISANTLLNKFINKDSKSFLKANKYLNTSNNNFIKPLYYKVIENNISTLNLRIFSGENDRLQYLFYITVFSKNGNFLDSLAIAPLQIGESVSYFSNASIDGNFQKVRVSFISKKSYFFSEDEKEVTRKESIFNLEFNFDKNQATYRINDDSKGLFENGDGIIFDIEDINYEYFSCKLKSIIKSFEVEKNIFFAAKSYKSSNKIYMIYSQFNKHRLLKHNGHSSLNFNKLEIKEIRFKGSYLIIEIANKIYEIEFLIFDLTKKLLYIRQIIIKENDKILLQENFEGKKMIFDNLPKFIDSLKL